MGVAKDSRLVVVIGAGASYDCVDPLEASADPDFKPPLTTDLFDNRPKFAEVLGRYPVVRSLSGEIRKQIRNGESLETLLHNQMNSPLPAFRKQFHQVPFYLQEIIYQCSVHYLPHDATVYDTLVREVLRSNFAHALFLTTNYDLFLDRAISGLYDREFVEPNDYLLLDQSSSLVKLHGSVSWWRRVLNQESLEMDVRAAIRKCPIDLRFSDGIVIAERRAEDAIVNGYLHYPAMSVPVDGKSDFNAPQEHILFAKEQCERATHLLVIGSKCVDATIKEVLSVCRSLERIYFVAEAMQSASEARGNLAATIPGITSASRLVDTGFMQFMRDGHYQSFIA